MTNGLPTAVRLMLACVLGALLVAPAAAADIRVGAADDHPKASPEVAGKFYEATNRKNLEILERCSGTRRTR